MFRQSSLLISALVLISAPTWASAQKSGLGTSDAQKLSREATRQLTHCEKLQGPLKVASEDFKNLTAQKVNHDEFLTTLNTELAAIGPAPKVVDGLAKLPQPETTKLSAELATASAMKGRRPSSVLILNIYAKNGERQLCKVTSELTKGGR